MVAETKRQPNRDARGRFVSGHKIVSPGRPPREAELANLEAFHAGCPPERLARIVNVLADKAEEGNLQAINILLRHALPIAALRLEFANKAPEEEFRIAGRTPAQVNREMIHKLYSQIKRQEEYERRLKREGYQFGINGS